MVLAEDQQHQTFIGRWLRQRGFGHRQIRLLPVVAGRGAGEQDVRERYPQEVSTHRQRVHRMSCWLVVLIDADLLSTQKRSEQLDQALVAAGLARRAPDESICVLLPRRNIETWIHFFVTGPVDEEADYKRPEKTPDECKQAADKLADTWPRESPPVEFPPALREGWQELKKTFAPT
ncbi:MAG: hypothetical protein ACJ8AT_28680 [Hyalangium sp.]|uniref:hypothetical protein n=1 Tax=Hyalangium sp. TaxID=2028555 RepID=UPI00389B0809